MKFTATVLAITATGCTAFTPAQPARASFALNANIVDTLATLQGPGQVWGAEGIDYGHEESDLKGYDNFSKFSALLQSTGVAQNLAAPGPFTVFAPTDSAIDAYEKSVGPVDANAISYCVVPGNIPSSALSSADLTTVMGDTLTYGRRFRKDFVNDAIIGEKTFGAFEDFPTDVVCDNGVIHSVGIMLKPN